MAPVQRALADAGYQTPTPIQAQTIPAALDGEDVLGCAQTGTGKTAAFALPILSKLGSRNRKATPRHPSALVLAPTRELAVQIGESFATYGKHLHLRQALIYGGVSQARQVRALNRGVHILIATPGRLIDLINQGHIELNKLETFVLDEADRMMDMGFLPDLQRIIRLLPQERQSLFFSATLAPKIVELAHELLHSPVSVNVTPKTTSVKAIDQRVLFVERGGKQSLLRKLLVSEGVEQTLVFTKTKRGADTLTKKLERTGITATAIHGNKSQNARQKALESFRRRDVQVLVATDVAARGIDIDGITHVVNYDMPLDPDSYVHRIGRTGRAGATGIALSFCSASERADLRAIEKLIGQKVPVDREYSSSDATHGEASMDEHSHRPTPARRRKSRQPTGNGSPGRSRGPRSASKEKAAASPPKKNRQRRRWSKAKKAVAKSNAQPRAR